MSGLPSLAAGLEGKTVVITGAGRGLGAAFARTLAQAKCKAILCGRRLDDLKAITQCVEFDAEQVPLIVQLDLSDPRTIKQACADIAAYTSHVDILINNGAMWLAQRSTRHTDAEVLQVVNTAISGTFLLVQEMMPLLDQSEHPDVLTIGSISGLPSAPLQSAAVPFYAAKRGQVALADGLRQTFVGGKFRSLLVNPPYLEDLNPDDDDWVSHSSRQKGQMATTRDVVEAGLYVLTRPRHLSLTIDMDADVGGQYPSYAPENG